MKKLPPFGRRIVGMLIRNERPALLGGALVAACSWDVGCAWPRIVVPDDPSAYRFDFAGGLDWLVLARDGHDAAHVAAVAEALRVAGAHVAVPVMLPPVEA